MTAAYLQRIGTATPPNDVHAPFVAYARSLLVNDREALLFDRMAERSGIAHRFSVLRPGRLDEGEIDADGFYRRGDFPDTAARMAVYEREALPLALRAVRDLGRPGDAAGGDRSAPWQGVTHLVVASCTGLVAPGLDVQLVDALGLSPDVQRTVIGFMGCAAALPALRLAQATVRADAGARVLVVNVELCSLHLHESRSIDELLSFLLFADGAAAALVGSEPQGAEILDFRSRLLPASRELITWDIGNHGFEMVLSGQVPGRIAEALTGERERRDPQALLRGVAPSEIDHWAVHAGGRTVLDAVQVGLALPAAALTDSRAVLQAFGNLSSATVMFVLQRMLSAARVPGALGLALAFGPGLSAETMRFRIA